MEFTLKDLPDLMSELNVSDISLIQNVRSLLESGVPSEANRQSYAAKSLEYQSKLLALRAQLYYLLFIYKSKKSELEYNNMCNDDYSKMYKDTRTAKMISEDPEYKDTLMYIEKIEAIYNYINSLCFTLKSSIDIAQIFI